MSKRPYEVIGDSAQRDEWLERRRTGIGASDAPAILGLTPWASPTSVQADKWGLIEEPAEAEHIRWGRRLEGAILAGLAEETGLDLIPHGLLLRSTLEPFMLCTPDGEVTGETFLPVECKNSMKPEEWQEGPPERVWVQAQHALFVTGAPKALVGALLLGNRLRWCWVERDDAFLRDVLIPAEREFWRLTEARDPAPPDASEATKRALDKYLYPEDTGETVALDGHFIDLDAERQELAAAKREAEGRLREIENEIRAAMKDASYGVLPNGVTYTLKTTHRAAYEVKATSFRALRRRKAK